MRQVSAVLQRRLREGDTLARLGGDEFGVLVGNAPGQCLAHRRTGLRQTVMECHFAWETRSFNIGVSIGLVNVADGMFTLTDVSAQRYRVLHGQGKGPKPRPGLSRRDSELSMRQGEMEWIGRLQKPSRKTASSSISQDIAGLDPAASSRTTAKS